MTSRCPRRGARRRRAGRLALSGRPLLAAALALAALFALTSSGAGYPSRNDPLVQQPQPLAAAEQGGQGRLGTSVALSADGDTVLVGAPVEHDGEGAAWVFERSGSGWSETELSPTAGEGGLCESLENEPEQEECGFGRSVALSADGATAVVGAPHTPGPCDSLQECKAQGAAWVYTRSSSGSWTLQAELTGGSEEGDSGRFGRSVAISADGNTVLVGAPADRGTTGGAWAFARAGTTWTSMGPELRDPAAAPGAHVGLSVALSGDGATALIGAPGEGEHAGAVLEFTRAGSTWTSAGRLTGSGEAGAGRFGSALALSADGGEALVGAPEDGEGAGAAFAFARGAGGFTQQGGKLTGGGEEDPPGAFGYSVALSSSGEELLIGAPRNAGSSGAAWLFARAGEGFTQDGPELLAEEAAGAPPGGGRFGASVTLRDDGAAALVGAPTASDWAGAVWSYVSPLLVPEILSVAPNAGPAGGGTTVTITGNRLAGATSVGFLPARCTKHTEEGCVVPAASFTVGPSGSITAVTPAMPAGTAYVVVSSPQGESAAGPASEFTFLQPPTVTELAPVEGPASGGSEVVISGEHLSFASSVRFGGLPARSFRVDSDRSITAISPAEPAGIVSVTVTTPAGTSRETTHTLFMFTDGAGVGADGDGGAGGPGANVAGAGGVLGYLSGCAPALVSRNVSVSSKLRAAVRLVWKGSGECAGKLTLRATVKVSRRRYRTRGIASTVFFTLSPNHALTLSIRLNPLGRKLMRGRKRALSASALLVKLSPGAAVARSASVRLLPPKRHKRKSRRR